MSVLDPSERGFSTGALVLRPGDNGYDEARRTFNGTIDHRPAVIVRCASIDDVVAAVRMARDAGLPIAVRGGGHGVAGHSMAAGTLVVDLRVMRGVTVDPAARSIRAGGGALWEDVDRAAFEHGLAVTGGTFWDTGIGGLTLGGGVGFLMGTNGLTCDNLVAATVVTADGDVVVAGDGGDPELLWALRGGGGNFGVVTEFVYRLRPVGPFTVGSVDVPVEPNGGEALALVAEAARSAPDEVVIMVVGPVSIDASGERVPPGTVPPVVRVAWVHQGDGRDLDVLLAPLRALDGASSRSSAATYLDVQAGDLLPFGLRNYWKGHFVRDLDGPAIAATLEALRSVPGGSSFVLLEAITGQARQEPEGGAAFGQREARWNVSGLAIWEDPAHDAAQIAWARRFADGLRPSSLTGAGYGNYSSADETAERIRASFGEARFERLQAVKRRYDPDNVFRANHNIPPAPG